MVTNGPSPDARSYHSACMLGQSHLFTYGGADDYYNNVLNDCWTLELKRKSWRKVWWVYLTLCMCACGGQIVPITMHVLSTWL